jgi:hypothetical protein
VEQKIHQSKDDTSDKFRSFGEQKFLSTPRFRKLRFLSKNKIKNRVKRGRENEESEWRNSQCGKTACDDSMHAETENSKATILEKGGRTYQNGPETPYCQATFDDCKRVAAHVH